jgi:RNA polymerase sigma-B factor
VGTLGLIGAIDRFKPAYGGNFLAFAVPTITGEIRRYFRDRAWAMRVPRRVKDLHGPLGAAVGRLSQDLGRAPRPSELAADLDVSLEDVIEALAAQNAYQNESLDKIGSVDGMPLAERVGALDVDLDAVEHKQVVSGLLETLPERERTIIMLRFFGNQTQSQIAQVIGVSQMHVSRLLDRTLKQLRVQLGAGDGTV